MSIRAFAVALSLAGFVASQAPANAQGGAAAKLTWMGGGADKVQAGRLVKPDGRPDGHFKLTVRSSSQRKIQHILLRSCDKRGVLSGRLGWDTDRVRLWVLGVYKRGALIATGRNRTVDTVRKQAIYHLYASKPLGGFKPGKHFCAYVTFTGGMGVSARTRISEPIRAGLTFADRVSDKVGKNRRFASDGNPDAHFVVRMLSGGGRSAVVRSVTLQKLSRFGQPLPGEVWDTRKRGAAWALGVLRGNRRLNKADGPLKNRFSGMAEYHLYAAQKTALKQGMKFRATVRFETGSASVAIVTVPKLRANVKAELVYLGLDADKIGPRSPSGPDSIRDGHFRLLINAPGGRKVQSVVLRAVWPGGGVVPGQIWDTRPRGYRMIAMYRGSKRLNGRDRGLKNVRVKGKQAFELYVHNTGWIRAKQDFQVEVVLATGDRVFAKAKVTPPRITGPVAVSLSHHGPAGDKVSSGTVGRADGKKDQKFSLGVDTGGRLLQITKIELSVSYPDGRTWRKTWDTNPATANWILGVAQNGKLQNPRDQAVSRSVQGKVNYTLWAANDFWQHPVTKSLNTYFVKGGFFTVRVYFASNPMVKKTIRLAR